MARLGKRRLALLVALAAILAGGTAVALGATGSSHAGARHGAHRRAHIHGGTVAAASSHLGLSPSRLRAELASGRTLGQIAAARDGRVRLREAVRSYLGIPRRQLRSELQSGRTLAQIADATPGRSAAGLREALISALRARLDTKVAAHVLSKTAEQHRIGRLEAKVAAVLGRSHPGRGLHAHKGGA